MQISYFPKYQAQNAAPVMEAFLQSCRTTGWEVVKDCMDSDAAVIWSQLWAGRMKSNQLIWQHYRQQNKPVIVLEVGSIQRNFTWRVMLNGRHCPLTVGNNSDRARQFGIVAHPWRTTGDKILIALQRSDSNLWHDMPAVGQWLNHQIQLIKQYTNRTIVVRPHPRQPIPLDGVLIQNPMQLPGTYDDFDFIDSLQDVYAVINHNSSCAVQSILGGIPAVTSSASIAASVSATSIADINCLPRPDRQQWVNDLAWSEWTVEEIAAGVPLQFLQSMISKTRQATIQPGQ
jgi:hypothetical protein